VTATINVLLVTSASADPAAVVPVLAACEAADLRVRAIDVGGAGASGGGISDRVRRVLLGETALRRLRKELDGNPPDVTLAFDPFAAQALSLARDQAGNPAPVVAVVTELEPATAWAEAGADRYLAVDEVAAVALADLGVEGDRILIAGPLGERAWADAAGEDRAMLRARFGLTTPAVVVEVAGLGAEVVGQLTMQLSLGTLSERLTYLFDAAGDADAAATLRRQVPALGLRAKLFGATADAPRYWRAAEVVVARPTPRAVARARLVGARFLGLIDDEIAHGVRTTAALEARGVGAGVKGLLLLSAGLEQLLAARSSIAPAPDGADQVIEVVVAVATDRRAVIEERRASAREETHARLRTATAAASAAARVAAMPGELEDLGGAPVAPEAPPVADLEALRREAVNRKQQLLREVDAARRAAEAADKIHSQARRDGHDPREHEQRAAGERAAMHKLLAELAALDAELAELDRATAAARAAGVRARPTASATAAPSSSSASAASSSVPPVGGASSAAPPRPAADPLAELKSRTAASSQKSSASLEDELAALKRKMADTPKKR